MLRGISNKISSRSKGFSSVSDNTKIVQEVVGEVIADLTDISIQIKPKAGLLIISTPSKVIANELHLRKQELVGSLNKRGVLIKELLVR